jgi:hypothetical protein
MLPAFSRCATLVRAFCIFLGCFPQVGLVGGLLVGLAPPLHAASGEPDELLDLCKSDSLPQDIRGSLSRNFSAWKILEPADLTARARTRWGSERPLTCPGIAGGHFQDAKNASYALLLIPADHSTTAYKLLVYTQQSGHEFYGFKALGQVDSGASDVFVKAVPTVRFFEATSKWVAHSHVSEAVMLVDSAATQAALYIYSEMSYEREPVAYQ